MRGRWHPDSGVIGFPVRRYALLKFPVPEAGPRAEQILRHEAAYLRVAQRLGLRVTQALPEFVDGALLIPRFDRQVVEGREVRLAPLYDFGPAFLDARNIVRTMRWDGEDPAGVAWKRVLENLATRFEEARVATGAWLDLIQAMHGFARDLEELPNVMRECGVDEGVIESRMRNIEQLKDELRAVRVPG